MVVDQIDFQSLIQITWRLMFGQEANPLKANQENQGQMKKYSTLFDIKAREFGLPDSQTTAFQNQKKEVEYN